MEAARILLAMSNDISLNKLRDVLAGCGYEIIDKALNANECLRKMRYLKPDLAVIDYGLSPQNGLEIARIADEDKLCDVILIVGSDQRDSIDYIENGYNFVVITKPLNRESLLRTVDIMVRNRRRVLQLETEIEDLRKTLDSRKEIEKAKGILMKNKNLSEDQAFRMIQKQSMNR